MRMRGHAGGDLRDETSLPSVAYTNRGPQPRLLARSMRREASLHTELTPPPTTRGYKKAKKRARRSNPPVGGRDQNAISEFRRLETSMDGDQRKCKIRMTRNLRGRDKSSLAPARARFLSCTNAFWRTNTNTCTGNPQRRAVRIRRSRIYELQSAKMQWTTRHASGG
jgi:hypothetical protein